MPPSKTKPPQDTSETSTARERQIAAAAHARKSKLAQQQANNHSHTSYSLLNGANNLTANGGSSLKELALVSTESGGVIVPGQNTGMAWSEASPEILNTYRVAHHLSTPAAFTSPWRQALLTNPGIGKQSPTMARKRDKRRVSREQLATAVRKNFNGAAVNEIDVVVELVYKVRNQDKAFRMRSLPAGVAKK